MAADDAPIYTRTELEERLAEQKRELEEKFSKTLRKRVRRERSKQQSPKATAPEEI